MNPRRAVVNVAIATLIFAALYSRTVLSKQIIDSSEESVVPLDIILVYGIGALLFVGLYENLICFESFISHPLLGLTFIVPFFIFIHEIRRNREYREEAERKDRYSVYRVSVLVTIAVAATSSLSKNARIKVACIALGAASTLFPFSSALPWTKSGAAFDTAQRVGLVSATWLIIALVSQEIASKPKIGYLFR